MRDKKLLRIALRYRAIYLDIDPKEIDLEAKPTPAVLAFVARLRENGFSVNEDLLHALCMVSATELAGITAVIDDVMGGVNLIGLHLSRVGMCPLAKHEPTI